jgi:anti-sigma factor RsiW
MSPSDQQRKDLTNWLSDRDLWRRSCLTEATVDEAAHFLDLAAFADGGLEPDERDRVAALLAGDPAATDDVSAAGAIDGSILPPGALDRIVARACATLPGEIATRVVAFPMPPRRHRMLHGLAQWGSLAAAIAMASWLGFAMGSDASRALSGPVSSSETSLLPELFDPGSGFLRDLGEVLRT